MVQRGRSWIGEARREAVLSKRSAPEGQCDGLGGQMEGADAAGGGCGRAARGSAGDGPGDGTDVGELGPRDARDGETVHTPMEVHLFSDMHRTNMPGNFADM